MPSAMLSPPSPLEHLKDRLDVPRTPSPGQSSLSNTASLARSLTWGRLCSTRDHQAQRPRVPESLIRRQGQAQGGRRRREPKQPPLPPVLGHGARSAPHRGVFDAHTARTQIVASNGFLPELLVQPECVPPPSPPRLTSGEVGSRYSCTHRESRTVHRVDWFYSQLGIDDGYFSLTSPQEVADHVEVRFRSFSAQSPSGS